ncbi:MAG TPA: DNA polymerase III subunit delta [bacterium]|nr:DNA polymerase III subunit delta [bacterium]
MIYFFYGADAYRLKEKVKTLELQRAKTVGTEKLEAANLNLDEIKNHLQANTLFAEQKLLVINGVLGKNFKAKEDFLKYLQDIKIPAEDIIIFTDLEFDRRTALFKLLRKKADQAVEFLPLKADELEDWIKEKAVVLNLKLKQDQRKKLAAAFLGDTWLAAMELEKIAAYVNGREVTDADLDLLVRGRAEDDIFKLTDVLTRGDKKTALKLMRDQLELGSNEIYLLSMLIRQFRILIQIKSALEAGVGEGDNYALAKILELHPFVVQKSLLAAKKYSFLELQKIYSTLEQTDLELKSSKVNKETLLVKLILEI